MRPTLGEAQALDETLPERDAAPVALAQPLAEASLDSVGARVVETEPLAHCEELREAGADRDDE